jgi:outer membrane protein
MRDVTGRHTKHARDGGDVGPTTLPRVLASRRLTPRPLLAGRVWIATAVGIVLLVSTGGCVAGVPHAGGTPVAPLAPSHLWRPPRDAQTEDSPREPNGAGRAGALPPQVAARAAALTLPEIVDLALRNNPITRESWAQAQAYANAYGAARAAYFPTLDGSVTAARSEQAGGASTSLGAASAAGRPRSTLEPAVSLSYTVLDFGVRSGNVASARETAYAMSFTHNATIQSTVLTVEQAFYTYVAARAVLEAQQQSLREAQVSYDAACQRDSVGLATKADVLQARTALAQAQLALDTADAQVQTTHTKLAVAFGAPASTPYDVAARAEDLDVADVTQNVDSLIDEALRRRPELQAARASVRAAHADVRAARGALFPSVSLSASSGYTDANVSALTGRNYGLSVGVSLPLFRGFANRYDIARAQAGVQYEAAYTEALRQSVASDVVTAYYQMQSAARQVRTTDDLFASASAAMEVACGRYEAGVGSIIDLLTAQASLASARAQRARSRWAWAQQLAALAYAAGALDERGSAGIPVAVPRTPPR